MADTRKSFHEAVAERLIEQLQRGTAPWQRPWQPGMAGAMLPLNPTTGKRYKGINAIQLMSQNRSDQRWMTYRQAAALGAQVRTGEKGTPIQYWKFSEEEIKTDGAGTPVRDVDGRPVMQTVQLERPKVFFATVFNAEQMDGLPAIERKEHAWNGIDRAERILGISGAEIHHGPQNRAFYRPATDSIHLPLRDQFATADNYYAIALHELGHWTGHASRLDRDLAHPFGSEAYAREELRAEIASMILGDELGIGHDPGQHAAYVASWIRTLQHDPLEVFRAAADAEKIRSYVLALEQKQVQEQDAARSQSEQERERFMDVLAEPRSTQPEIPMGSATAMNADPEGQPETGVTMEVEVSQTNALPASGTPEAAPPPYELSTTDACVAAARLAMVAHPDAPKGLRDTFDQTALTTFGFGLPHDWNGRVQVQGSICLKVDGRLEVHSAHAHGIPPEFWGVYAQHQDGTHEWLADYPTEHEATQLAERLTLIGAHSEANEHERAAKFARIHEDRLRRDPASTREALATARGSRKQAESSAMLHDADLQQRIADFERSTEQGAVALPVDVVEPVTDQVARDASRREYIAVPFKEKNEARSLGAKWDRREQSWYVPPGLDMSPFAKWAREGAAINHERSEQSAPAQNSTTTSSEAEPCQYLAVPYGDRDAAKAAGALWDKSAKSWYAGPKADLVQLQRWHPENLPAQQAPAMTPQEEFAVALRALGCHVIGPHPIMDGATHRIGAKGDRKGEQAGFYVAHLDGHPAGYIKNNRTGAELNWKSKGYALEPEERARLLAESAQRQQARAAELARLQEKAAERVTKQLRELVPATQPTPYMRTKGIWPEAGAFTDKDGQTTFIPGIDADGKQWTMQYIAEDGTKRFAKNSRKDGCFHVVGGALETLAKAPALVICEGYATAASVSEAICFPAVAAFDSGNLPFVAKALHARFPDKPVIIAGDDDRHLEVTQGINPGKAKAQEAAEATGGRVVLPIFGPGQSGDDPKGFTDFNDLATKSTVGRERVARQLLPLLWDVMEKRNVQIGASAQQPGKQRGQPLNRMAVVQRQSIGAG